MSGFDNAKVDAEFFRRPIVEVEFPVQPGARRSSKLFPRNPRFEFDEVCKLL